MIPIYRLLYSRTPKIKDGQGNVKPNSVSILTKIVLNGLKQAILIRGHDKTNPILLYVHGGPGTPEMGIAYKFQGTLEKYFTVVNWDQRGSGRSFSRKIPYDSMNNAQFIEDCADLVRFLLQKLGQKKVFLMGHSWGSILGVYAVQKYPELFHAYIGVGQVVNMLQNEKLSFQFVYEEVKKNQDRKGIQALEKLQPYTGLDPKAMHTQRKWLDKYHGTAYKINGMATFIKYGFGSPEYNIFDYYRFLAGEKFSLKFMWDPLFATDLFTQVPELKVPVYICQGRHDYQTPFELAERYFNGLKAPKKEFIWFEESAHSPNLEEPEKFNSILIKKILPDVLP